MSFPAHIKTFEWAPITIVPATASDFDSRVRTLFPKGAGALLQLKPYLALISNQSSRTIVGCDIVFRAAFANGRNNVHYLQLKYPDAVFRLDDETIFPRGREIYPGEERLVGSTFEVSSEEYAEDYRNWGQQQNAELRNAAGLSIELDALIFEDGVLLGPDAPGFRGNRYTDHFRAYLRAKQELYRAAVEKLDAGQTVEDVFRAFPTRLADQPRNPFGIYPELALEEARRWRKLLGDKGISEALHKAVRVPFTLRKSSGATR